MENENSTSVRTLQGIDYTATSDACKYGDAYCVPNATLCSKKWVETSGGVAGGSVGLGGPSKLVFDTSQVFPTTLVFCAGPNAGARVTDRGSTARTLHARAQQDFFFFRDCLKEAVAASLDALVDQGCTIALVAQVSCGIYAGDHRSRIGQDFLPLLNEVLAERVGPSQLERGCYFEAVLVPKLTRRPIGAATSPGGRAAGSPSIRPAAAEHNGRN
jgi:hypothetical protein